MKLRKSIALLLLLALVLTLAPGVSYAEPPVGPCDGRFSERNQGNHSWYPIDHKDPTCLESGYTTYRCTYCQREHTDTIPPLGHDWWGPYVVKAPTCTEDGLNHYVCHRDSSHEFYATVPALGHDWSEWYVVKEPTLTEEGIEERKCQRCGITEQRPIPPLGQKEDYGLALIMTQTDPMGNVFAYEDLYGEYGITIDYNATLVNTGKLPLNVSDFYAGGGSYGSLKPPVVLYPGESCSVPLMRDLTEYDIVLTPNDLTVYATAAFEFYFYGDSFDGEEHVCCSNTVAFSYSIKNPEGFDEWDIPSDSTVDVWKTLDNAPADPNGWQLGETLYYTLYARNTGDLNIESLVLYDIMDTYGEEAVLTVPVAIDEIVSASFQHTVNAQDVNNGYISNYAEARWHDPGDGEPLDSHSDAVTVTVINKASLVLQKTEASIPANGHYYVPGETVHFQVHVWNNSNVHHKAIMIVDPLTGETKVIDELPPDAHVTLDFYYVVTELDAILTYVENYAYAMEADNAVSNIVRVDTGFDGPTGYITDLVVTKVETSTPKDPRGYQEGETITYVITVKNVGETTIVEGTVSDSLKGGSGEIGSFELLYPDTSRTFNFSYTVTAADVHSPKMMVYNQAAAWYNLGGHGAVQTSNIVESPVWCEDPYGHEWDDDGSLLSGDDCCTRTLTGKGSGTDAFTVHFCAEHLKVLEELAELKATGISEEEYLKAARTSWQEAMDAMYEAAQEKAGSEAAAALMSQRLTYLAYLDTYEALLSSFYPTEPLVVARELEREMQDRCVDLCYDLHEAPKARVDSVLGAHDVLDAVTAQTCGRAAGERDGAELKYAEILCADHAATDERIMAIVQEAGNREARTNAFLRAQRMWQTMMDNRTNASYKAADKEGKTLIAANRKAFDKYLTARKALLTLLYPDQPDVVAEVIARTILDKEIDLCLLWK